MTNLHECGGCGVDAMAWGQQLGLKVYEKRRVLKKANLVCRDFVEGFADGQNSALNIGQADIALEPNLDGAAGPTRGQQLDN